MRNLIPILITLCIALFLTLLPMPDWAVWARPAWVLMVLIFWAMTLPQQVNVGFAWLSGLALDVLTGTMLGEHAVACTIVIYLVYRSHRRINMYPLLQQGFSILVFVFIYQGILYSIQGFVSDRPQSHWYWLSSLSSMLLWPWLFVVMRDYCQWVRVGLANK
jgi:rod shape-determining protein MreD